MKKKKKKAESRPGRTDVVFHSPKHVKQHCDGNLILPVLKKDTTSKIP